MKEFLIHPLNLQYPLVGRDLIRYDIKEIATVVIEGKQYAKDTGRKNIPELLPFEPYVGMHHLIKKFLQ